MRTLHMVFFLVVSVFGLETRVIAVSGTWSSDLVTSAESLVQKGRIHLTGDVSCEVGRGYGAANPAHTGSDAEALLRVASEHRIYLFAHGFVMYARRTKPPASYVHQVWSGHLSAIRDRGEPYAACFFITDMAKGFSDHQNEIGNFLFALRGLTDDAELYNPQREIILVGYSAGVNYLKQGLLTYQKHLAKNDLAPTGIEPTPMTIIFLAGVHQGAAASDLARSSMLLFNQLGRSMEGEAQSDDATSDQEWREFERSEREALVVSRGAMQLRMNSPELVQLNRRFANARTDNLRIINIASKTDFLAPPSTTQLSFVNTILIDNFSHEDFVGPPQSAKTRFLTEQMYSRTRQRSPSKVNSGETE